MSISTDNSYILVSEHDKVIKRNNNSIQLAVCKMINTNSTAFYPVIYFINKNKIFSRQELTIVGLGPLEKVGIDWKS